jgi:hypothetical protein
MTKVEPSNRINSFFLSSLNKRVTVSRDEPIICAISSWVMLDLMRISRPRLSRSCPPLHESSRRASLPAGLQRSFISAQNCDPSHRVVEIVSPTNDTLTATLDGFFSPLTSIIGPWRADGRASRSKSSSQRLTHRSSRNNDLHPNRRPRNRNGTPLHCPVGTSFSNSRKFSILGTGKCLKPLFQNSTGG